MVLASQKEIENSFLVGGWTTHFKHVCQSESSPQKTGIKHKIPRQKKNLPTSDFHSSKLQSMIRMYPYKNMRATCFCLLELCCEGQVAQKEVESIGWYTPTRNLTIFRSLKAFQKETKIVLKTIMLRDVKFRGCSFRMDRRIQSNKNKNPIFQLEVLQWGTALTVRPDAWQGNHQQFSESPVVPTKQNLRHPKPITPHAHFSRASL